MVDHPGADDETGTPFTATDVITYRVSSVPSVNGGGPDSLAVAGHTVRTISGDDSPDSFSQYTLWTLAGDTVVSTSFFTGGSVSATQRRATQRLAQKAVDNWLR